MMKYLALTVVAATAMSALLSTTAVAQQQTIEQCDVNAHVIKANYQQQQKQGDTQQFGLWRLNAEVAHQSMQSGVVDKWQQLSTGQMRPVRYFEQYQRAIEYQPGELRSNSGNVEWAQKYQLVSDNLLQTPVREQGQGCEREQYFEHASGTQKLAVTWLPELQLVKTMIISEQNDVGEWQVLSTLKLQSYQLTPQLIERQFALWDRYQSTDYADVGDNEQDAFLSKMINQGFIEHGASGFYSSDGHALGGHHH
ncbi:hypothetical protein V1358_17205 [Pseudoalteromonas sp. YIC-656]|uniref:hypothetical protein n=1 Tax=Pseudoalteromonas pernae TaxID=3118054 RepID=UPI003242C74B